MGDKAIFAIDQGTTSSRAILYSPTGEALVTCQQEFTQYFPNDGWVEHDPEEIWRVTLDVCQQAMQKAQQKNLHVAAIGITNQRETTVIWDRESGKPIYNAIVWQDRRTAGFCDDLKAQNKEKTFTEKTGLLLDPYFSGTKVRWLLDHVKGARQQAEAGKLCFGTIDTFLLWRLTEGKSFATDATNASRTLLFNIHRQCWDDELLKELGIPGSLLPEVKDCAADFGQTTLLGNNKPLPIAGIAGDQHAASIGQACFQPGMIKSTYGTGCFAMLNTGTEAKTSNNRLLTTVAYRIKGDTSYALEGAIFVAGAAVQWLRDGLGLIANAKDTEALAKSTANNKGVYLVPAFTGLGAPYWDANARGGLFGLTRDTGVADMVRATLESVCYQTADLTDAMAKDGQALSAIRVDGGMVNNDWLMQFLANILNLTVQRPTNTETTALGAAMLAALQIGWFQSLEDIADNWQLDKKFEPKISADERQKLLAGWHKAVARIREN